MGKNITIGRDVINDLRIPQEYNTVSNRHAEIEETDGGRLYLIDHSTNGSMVNGRKIRNMRLEISEGDEIRLADAYPLQWNDIKSFFPHLFSAAPEIKPKPQSRATQLHPTPITSISTDKNRDEAENIEKQLKQDLESVRNKWSWGAFLLGWIWAAGHNIWWPLLVLLVLPILSAILLFVFAPIGFILFALSGIVGIVISINLGIRGNSQALDKGCFKSFEHFRSKERKWTIVGVVVWIISIATSVGGCIILSQTILELIDAI